MIHRYSSGSGDGCKRRPLRAADPVHAAVREYLAKGYAPVPVEPGTKEVKLKGWPNLRISEQDIPRYWNNGQGVGLVLGLSGLLDIDIDNDVAARLAPYFLPQTGMIGGHDNRPATHWFYRCSGGDATAPTSAVKFAAAPDDKALMEIRCGRALTVVAPSRHPSGSTYRWYCVGQDGRIVSGDVPGEPAAIEWEQAWQAAGKLAAAALLVQLWSEGRRHELVLPLAGALKRAGWDQQQTEQFVQAVCTAAKDPEVADRLRAVHDTYSKPDTEPTTGWSRLKEHLGGAADMLRQWLGLQVAP
ncbi:MAG: bifunctional DNA primase/polymerase, partial [Gemmataceae bacterium]|nr:bifunctional DNA primase/polymerase [Gemmataceae bacterium]